RTRKSWTASPTTKTPRSERGRGAPAPPLQKTCLHMCWQVFSFVAGATSAVHRCTDFRSNHRPALMEQALVAIKLNGSCFFGGARTPVHPLEPRQGTGAREGLKVALADGCR
ncbi:hypothetical protein, partial [Acidovorax sp. SRB_24]|uniref:hypothetical protein n=1 Tax=Acidovorax sp. SRB_24 TaxID=1962700 RepID=UPI00197B54C1